MNRHARLLALGAVTALVACVAAVVVPGAALVGDVAMAAAELAAAVLIWAVGGRGPRGLPGWRVLAIALVVPVVWTVIALATAGSDALSSAYFSWAPTIPAFLLAMAASWTFMERARLRSGGPRLAVELVLFTSACFVGLQTLVLGPDDGWATVDVGERVTLVIALLTMSASMAVGLTLLGVVEGRRQDMALCLLAGSVLMSVGQAMAASPALAGFAAAADASRFLVVAGMVALGAAVLVDPGRSSDRAERLRPATGAWTRFRQVAPHVAMVGAMLVVVGASVTGHHPDPAILTGVVCCVALAAVHRWLTAREEERVSELLQQSEAYFRSLVRSSSDGVVIVDDGLRISWTSPALDWATTPDAAALNGRALVEVVHPEDASVVAAALTTAGTDSRADGEGSSFGLLLFRLRDAGGAWRYLEAGVSDVRGDADVGALVLHCRDMTERHAREQAVQNIAFTDPMTGLPNRAGVLQTLQAELATDDRGPSSLLMIALDGLAEARENVGREIVTTVVAEIGRRLRATVREEDTVARMGGGAFAVLTHGGDGDADRLAARCLSVVEQPFVTPAGLLELTAGVGVAPLEAGLGVDDLLARADLAVRAAHTNGAGSSARYCPSLGEAAARQERLRTDLQGACARAELFLLVQPIVSVAEERITGLEAQLRWRHPELGEIPPAEFLTLAERTGLIGEVVRWALEEATSVVAGLPDGEHPLRIGFKVPAGHAATGTLVADVEQALARSGLAPERLVLQVSASTVMAADDRTGMDITSLRLMGVHVALDGFGSGNSALAHLTQLPIDIVRLDRTMIARIDRDPQSRALCESVIGIAKALSIDVVAEGVETPAQLAALAGFGCDFVQGFLVSRPVPLARLTTMLAEGAGSLLPGFVSRV